MCLSDERTCSIYWQTPSVSSTASVSKVLALAKTADARKIMALSEEGSSNFPNSGRSVSFHLGRLRLSVFLYLKAVYKRVEAIEINRKTFKSQDPTSFNLLGRGAVEVDGLKMLGDDDVRSMNTT